MPLLSAVLLCLPQLEKFYIHDNDIEDEGLEKIAPALEQCSQLTVLYLRKIGVCSNQSLLTISRILQQLTSLKELGFYSNNIQSSEKNEKVLVSVVSSHPSLEWIYLPDSLGNDSYLELESLARTSSVLKCVYRG